METGNRCLKELAVQHLPYAEAETEAFRRDWVAKYEKGEIDRTYANLGCGARFFIFNPLNPPYQGTSKPTA